jgi:putative FmdB family regulatory protein
MPIFEFQCQTCGAPFEELLRSSNAIAEVTCPECGGSQVRKKVSTFASKITGASLSFGGASAASCNTGST